MFYNWFRIIDLSTFEWTSYPTEKTKVMRYFPSSSTPFSIEIKFAEDFQEQHPNR